MAMIDAKLLEVATRDPRYSYEAYDFIFKAMEHSQALLNRRQPVKATVEDAPPESQHVKSRELLEGIRSLALMEFGLMARVVFRMWGVQATEDFGRIVFNLVDAGLLSKTDEETLSDFRDVFDFDADLTKGYTIELDEAR
jgi:uncharacterized repeat protein (TIGR04138 family)